MQTIALVLSAIALPHVVDAFRTRLFGPGLWTLMFVMGGVAILLVAGWHAARTGFRVAIALLLMPLLFAGPARESFLYTSVNTTSRDDFRALMSFNEVLKAAVPIGRRVVFWADRDEPDDYLFVSAQSLWVYGGYDFSRAFQGAVPDDIRDQLSAKTTLVQLTDHAERIGEHLKLLDAHGVRYGNQRQWTVRSGKGLFYMAAEDIFDISGMR